MNKVGEIQGAHEFSAFPWTLGPYGRQDVHLHSCVAHDRCEIELVGKGRACEGKGVPHYEKRLTARTRWNERGHEGEPLDPEDMVKEISRAASFRILDALLSPEMHGVVADVIEDLRSRPPDTEDEWSGRILAAIRSELGEQ